MHLPVAVTWKLIVGSRCFWLVAQGYGRVSKYIPPLEALAHIHAGEHDRLGCYLSYKRLSLRTCVWS